MENQPKTTTTDGAEWMSTRDAADYLGVSIKTTRRWAQEILSGKDVRPRGSEQVLTKARRNVAGLYSLQRRQMVGLLLIA